MAILQTLFILCCHYPVPSSLVHLFTSVGQQIQQNPDCQIHCPNHLSHLLHDHPNWCRLLAIVSHLSWINATLLDWMAFVSLVVWRNFGTIHRKARKERLRKGISSNLIKFKHHHFFKFKPVSYILSKYFILQFFRLEKLFWLVQLSWYTLSPPSFSIKGIGSKTFMWEINLLEWLFYFAVLRYKITSLIKNIREIF